MLYSHPDESTINNIYWLEIVLLLNMCIHKKCYRWIECIFAFFIFGLVIAYVYYTFYDDLDANAMYQIFIAVDWGAFGIARIILIYYFLFIFKKYPWNHITEFFYDAQFCRQYIAKVRWTNCRLKSITVVYIMVETLHFFGYFDKQQLSHETSFAVAIDSFSSIYGVYTPMMVSQCVLTFIFLKYDLYLYTVIEQIKRNQNTDIQSMFALYRKMHMSFQKEYKIWKIILMFEYLATFYVIWAIAATSMYQTSGLFEIHKLLWIFSGIYYLFPFMEYVYCSSKINNQYSLLMETLWEYDIRFIEGKIYEDNTKLSISGQGIKVFGYGDIAIFESFFQYTRDHPFIVTLIGARITSGNAVKLIVAFCVAKMISYSIYNV
eukprot:297476_1